MKWRYKNNTEKAVVYRNIYLEPGKETEVSYPIPSYLGLTCIQEGDTPDPVLYHDDILIEAGGQRIISLEAPAIIQYVALTILCMTANGGVECRFNSANNKAIPIDSRGFQQVMLWDLCSKIILNNPTDITVHISITAIEAVR